MTVQPEEKPLTRREIRERERREAGAGPAAAAPTTSRRAATASVTAAGDMPVLTPTQALRITPVEPRPASESDLRTSSMEIVATENATGRPLTRRELRALLAQQQAEKVAATPEVEPSAPADRERSGEVEDALERASALPPTGAVAVVEAADESRDAEPVPEIEDAAAEEGVPEGAGTAEQPGDSEASGDAALARAEPDEPAPEDTDAISARDERTDDTSPSDTVGEQDDPQPADEPEPEQPHLNTALFASVGGSLDIADEKATEITGSFEPPIEHLAITEELDSKSKEDVDASFDSLIASGVAATGAVTTTNALILPTTGPGTSVGTDSGEILVTGSFDLPRSLGSTGQHPNLYDSPDVDRYVDRIDREQPAGESEPVRASSAVSTHAAGTSMIAPQKRAGISVPVVLAVTAAVLLVASIALFIGGFVLNIF
ncbi:hypothetical protein C5C31_03820 [Rathayibacter rathayi]|uniref:Uncharacterized protein n=1 Tax=Rathayibacter rathayi TaxID=33887 RepID=A0ABX5A994_RATRA|nr:hypothetical protein [Rathayibacter rathayi]AZZ48842.1 hypothetical protein C1O28_06240 [Rathayibacter rathayi]MWV73935.1 hypothetical protein [Rathayibacter rathayi NCPPB 2980 = VKM Ac-1601]PPF48842.1 hypothetical protein C5C08_08565 [Rathayibacter rathayi]PPF79849.1 hypothetical protein C5C14_08100 [Rathayibacter rathayi]PPG46398.1 hypothetical protein C5C20_02795 [Rathayibacter rathayi]